MVLRKSFYIRWSAGRSPQVHEVNPGRDPSTIVGTRKGFSHGFLRDHDHMVHFFVTIIAKTMTKKRTISSKKDLFSHDQHENRG